MPRTVRSIAPSPAPVNPNLYFEQFELQVHERQLLAEGEPLALGGRAFDVLLALAQRAGQLVTKNELLDQVWPGLVVEEHNIAAQISLLRKVLGNALIATVPGRGYRFIAKVNERPSQNRRASSPTQTEQTDQIAPADQIIPTPQLPSQQAPAAAKLITNLPAVLTALIGRETELAELAALVGAHPLVTVIGPGGMGKTLLVQQLLDTQQAAYEHGVCWVDLAGLSDGDAVPSAIALAFGITLGMGDPLQNLSAAVAPFHILLALDNAEHLVQAVARVADAVGVAAPRIKLIVTSQAPLQLRVEQLYRLQGLSVPSNAAGAALPSVSETLAHGAVGLFVARARAVDRHFALTDANQQSVCTLCRQLDCCALAIELAAARLPMLGVHGLLKSMDTRMQTLTRGHRDAPNRQQSLRATLDWSHALLDAPEQTVFRRMAVFVGSAALADILHVATDAADLPDSWVALDALGTLVDRSLVSLVPPERGDEPRYRLLETPRAYALEKLAAACEELAVRKRHAQAMATRIDPLLTQDVGLDALVDVTSRRGADPDLDNLTAAWAWACQHNESELALKNATILLHELPISSFPQKITIAEASESMVTAGHPAALRVWLWWGISWHWSSIRSQRSLDAARACLAAAREPGTAPGRNLRLYSALGIYAQSVTRLERPDDLDALLDELRALESPAWSVGSRLTCLTCISNAYVHLGRTSEALALIRQEVQVRQSLGGNTDFVLSNLADRELAAGNAETAVRIGRELAALAQGTRAGQYAGYERVNLCAALLALDQVDEALDLARRFWPEAGRLEIQPVWGEYMSLLTALQGRYEVSARLAGFVAQGYRRFARFGEPNELNARKRTQALAVAALGEPEFERLRQLGESLRDEEIGPLVFGGQ